MIELHFEAGQVGVFKTFRFPEPKPKRSRKFKAGGILDFSNFLHMLQANSTIKMQNILLNFSMSNASNIPGLGKLCLGRQFIFINPMLYSKVGLLKK